MGWKLPRIEGNRADYREDPRWVHPELVNYENWQGSPRNTDIGAVLTDPDRPIEERKKARLEFSEGVAAKLKEAESRLPESVRNQGVWKEFRGDAYPDIDPDDDELSPVHVLVREPRERTGEPLPCVFRIAGGGMMFGDPREFQPWLLETSHRQNAVVVSPWFRGSVEGQYPASINDLHAAFRWTVENAELLNIDPDKIVITGASGGGLLVLSLAFRLKRFGYRPRGCVANEPITEDRMVYPSQKGLTGQWDGIHMTRGLKQYLTREDYNSPFLGPEALVGRATVEDCIGLCPIFIHTSEHEPDRDPTLAFMNTLYRAGVYAEVHQWGGTIHGSLYVGDADQPYKQRYESIFQGNIADCLKYDLRRDWYWDEKNLR
ncbi:alpha/beta hydrolase [Streptomyces phaeochromogenes]|uniref:alpha/beta hydrolase n=1 Tax=Streptomyces phaeochromogenes TaxID=1923 RepID=UPI002DD82EF4|nr:alpha/beta hydrolase [Streptomyces phaeochromogenes]WRZ34654.1 alpha/beta hydrolase [Streptomyces phaeochromogenes]